MGKHARHACIIVLFFGGAAAISVTAGSITFFSEHIEIVVHGDHCTVTGDYLFKNDEDSVYRGVLYYPFAIESDLPFPHIISVEYLEDGSDLSFVNTSEGIRFPITLDPHDSVTIRVSYAQSSPEGHMRYILTTTERWRRPLTTADFIIRSSICLSDLNTNIPPDSILSDGDWRVLKIHRNRFMPSKDLKILWGEAAS